MKGDYSRFSFDSKKHYRAVLMQQGRLQLDSDWNEQVQIGEHRYKAFFQSMVGRSGTPRGMEMKLKVVDGQLHLTKGAYYIDGLLIENEEEIPLDLPGEGEYLYYIDAWTREVSAAEDDALIDPAVDLETTTRLKTEWVVRRQRMEGAWQEAFQAGEWPDEFTGDWWQRLTTGTLTLVSLDMGVDNRLYRIEVHRDDLGVRFKGSSDNACTCAEVTASGANTFTLKNKTVEMQNAFKGAAWVELFIPGETGQSEGSWRMVEISEKEGNHFNSETGTLSLETPWNPEALDETSKIIMRRWEGVSREWEGASEGGSFEFLGFGFRFSEGFYRHGDCWLIETRNGKPIHWRIGEEKQAEGVEHHFAALGGVRIAGGVVAEEPKSLCVVFNPLTSQDFSTAKSLYMGGNLTVDGNLIGREANFSESLHIGKNLTVDGDIAGRTGSFSAPEDPMELLVLGVSSQKLVFDSGIADGKTVGLFSKKGWNLSSNKKWCTAMPPIATLAGSGTAGFADGVGADALFSFFPVKGTDNPTAASGITIDRLGNLYVADTANCRIRKVTPDGEVSTLAGSGEPGIVDGVGTAAMFAVPCSIAIDRWDNLYVTDSSRICKVTQNGEVNNVVSGSQVRGLGGITIDRLGNLYVTNTIKDPINNLYMILKVTPNGEVSWIAGGTPGFVNGTGSAAKFSRPAGIAIDRAGNLYVADCGNHCIRKITLEGEVSTFVGNENGEPGDADGLGSDAQFNGPHGIAIDALDNLYVTDTGNCRIRKVTPEGEVSTLEGSGETVLVNDAASDEQVRGPYGITIDRLGNLYVTDTYNHRIRRMTPASGNHETVTVYVSENNESTARSATVTFQTDDGLHTRTLNVTQPPLRAPVISGFLPSEASCGNALSIFGGNFNTTADNNGVSLNGFPAPVVSATATQLTVTVPSNRYCSGNIKVAVGSKSAVSAAKFSYAVKSATVSTIAGSGARGFKDDVGSEAQFDRPVGIIADAAGNLYVADTFNHRIRKVTPNGDVSTFAGAGPIGIENGSRVDGIGDVVRFNQPTNIVIDEEGNLCVTDSGSNLIRKVILFSQAVITVAGSYYGYVNSNNPLAALFATPYGILIDADKDLYVAELNNHCIRKVTSTGIVSTFVGPTAMNTSGYTNSGGLNARFNNPWGIAVDSLGDFYVTDSGNHCIRKVTRDGNTVSTFAGPTAPNMPGFADGFRTAARFQYPYGIAIDAEDNLYVADNMNHCIRKVTPDGMVSTIAGKNPPNAQSGSDDGEGAAARFKEPCGLTLDAFGNLYVADTANCCIRKIVLE